MWRLVFSRHGVTAVPVVYAKTVLEKVIVSVSRMHEIVLLLVVAAQVVDALSFRCAGCCSFYCYPVVVIVVLVVVTPLSR